MERVVFGVCLDGSDYERRCVPRGFLAHNREETVFLFARLQAVLLDQGVSPDRSCGAHEGSRSYCERPNPLWILSNVTGAVIGQGINQDLLLLLTITHCQDQGHYFCARDDGRRIYDE
jgi:hypothetical protein